MKEEILNKSYISTKDLMVLTGLGRETCTKYMREMKTEMEEKNMFIPLKKKLMIPTKIVRKKFGI